jgi:HPt (histidine-containing phosphotransfer) domain-containing protein
MENQPSISNDFLVKLQAQPVLNGNTFANLKKQTQSHPELLKEIFNSFFEDAHEMMDGLNSSVQEQDYGTYTATLHTLKGLSGTIGATRLHEITNLLYSQARASNFSAAPEGLPLLHQCIVELKTELDGEL